jgi:transcriptional regulator with XRE-family HTH domain
MTGERVAGWVSDYVAASVRELRKAKNWRTGDLAAQCSSLSENSIENIEGGRRRGGRRREVTVDELWELASALRVSPDFLLPGMDYPDAIEIPAAHVERYEQALAAVKTVTAEVERELRARITAEARKVRHGG